MASGRLTYRPELDGVRGLGMALILSYHLSQVVQGHPLGTPAGGWIGLDLFFALSGLLITRLLVFTWDSVGSVSLTRFYGRRAARLAPALIVLLGAQVLATSLDGTSSSRSQLPGSLAWVLSQFGNFGLLAGGFLGKLDQTWSLAVEEQFYLIWPLLLLLALRAGWSRQRLRRWLGAAIVVLTLAGLVTSLVGVSPEVTYFATPFRVSEILVGCWVALGGGARQTPPLLREAALLLLAAVAVFVPQNSHLPADGGYTLIAVCAAVVMMEAPRPWWGHRVLACPPLRLIGRISYSVYLWHWPTYYAVRFTLGVDRPVALLVAPVAAIALALLSWRFVETPFRRAAATRHLGLPASAALLPLAQIAIVGGAAASTGLQVLPAVVAAAAGAVLLTGLVLGQRQRQHGRPRSTTQVHELPAPARTSVPLPMGLPVRARSGQPPGRIAG